MSIKKTLIFILLIFPLQSFALDCPDNTNKVEFTSPVTGEDKKWCQLNIDGKLLKHGPLVIYKDGRLAKKEFYIKGKLQKVGLFKAVDGESLFHFDAFLACVLQANHKTVKCRQSITLPQPHHVFHRTGEEYTFEFPYKINDLYNDYLSLCGYSEEVGDLICYDPSFHRIRERLKNEKLYISDGHYKFKETWSDGKEYNRQMAVEYVDKVTIDTKNPNYFRKKLKSAKRILIHQFYACIFNEQTELDCFTRPPYGNEGSTFYNEKPFPNSFFVGGSFTHFCVQKSTYVYCYYFKPKEGFEQKAYAVEKLRFVGPIDPYALKQLYRNTLFWINKESKIDYKQLKGGSSFVHPELEKLLPKIKNVKDVKRFSFQNGEFCFLDSEGQLSCILRRVIKGTRVRGNIITYDSLKQLFPKNRFQEIFRPDLPEQTGQFCLKYQGAEKYFCFQSSEDSPVGKDYSL